MSALAETPSQFQQTEQQQLPPVRHLLAPDTRLITPLPSSYHQPCGTPKLKRENHELPSSHHQHGADISSQVPPVVMQDIPKTRSESSPQLLTRSLPPLSQVVTHSPGDVKHYTSTPNDFSAWSFQHAQSSYHDAPYHDKDTGTDISSPESGANRPKASLVLPHVVDERYIEGEGICYVYADGSHVPKSIDGIPVNANWGVTKAGKPRKRLAQACLTCREKKIKCQPNLPKCDQCQRSGRECRFESA